MTQNGDSPSGGAPHANDAIEILGQASLLCVTSAARYWARLAEVWGRHFPALAGALNHGDGAAPEAGHTITEQIKAALRELAELPIEEAQRLSTDLERLAHKVRPSAAEPDSPYWRRWDVKP